MKEGTYEVTALGTMLFPQTVVKSTSTIDYLFIGKCFIYMLC